MKGRKIVLGITGSIAAYKACYLASEMVQHGAEVTCVMTEGATRFVTPLTLQALTDRRPLVGAFDDSIVDDSTHIKLARDADLLLIAPATANVISKIACGIADDILTSFVLAVLCPVVIAPAMNTAMWEAKIIRQNVATLRRRGYTLVDPEVGFLACRDEGRGRLASVENILKTVRAVLAKKR